MPSDDTFDGDIETARQRLRDLTNAACQALDARTLNLASYHLAVYLDNQAAQEASKQPFSTRIIDELAAEQRPGSGEDLG